MTFNDNAIKAEPLVLHSCTSSSPVLKLLSLPAIICLQILDRELPGPRDNVTGSKIRYVIKTEMFF